MNANTEIGERLYLLRKKKGKTQAEVAKAIGTGTANYTKMESGERDIKTEFYIALAEYFDTTCDYLIRGRSEENKQIFDDLGLSDETISILKNRRREQKQLSEDHAVIQNYESMMFENWFTDTQKLTILQKIDSFLHADFSCPFVYQDTGETVQLSDSKHIDIANEIDISSTEVVFNDDCGIGNLFYSLKSKLIFEDLALVEISEMLREIKHKRGVRNGKQESK